MSGQQQARRRDKKFTSERQRIQESLILPMVVMVKASIKVLEKVASNLALMFFRTPPGRRLDSNGGI